MKCINCGNELRDGAAFCSNCGAKTEGNSPAPAIVREPKAQPVQRQVTMNEINSVPAAAVNVADVQPEQSVVQPEQPEVQNEQPVQEKPKKKKSAGKVIIILVVILLLLLLLIGGGILAYFIFSGDKEDDYDTTFMYMTEDSFYVATDDSYKNYEEIYVNNLFEEEDDHSHSHLNRVYVRGKKLVYAQDYLKEYKLENGENINYSIYTKTLGKEEVPVKIADNVTGYYYAISDDGDSLMYLKGDELYYNDFKEEILVCDNVDYWCTDNKLEKVLYLVESSEDTYKLNLADISKTAEITYTADGIEYCSDVCYVSDEVDEFAYIASKTLYLYSGGKTTTVAENINGVLYYGEDGVYYTEEYEADINADDFVIDEYKMSDSELTMPDEADYQEPYTWYGYTFYTTSNEYYTALNEYNEKLDRDAVRALFEGTVTMEKLCYYNGKESVVISETYSDDFDYLEEGKIAFSAYDFTGAKKVNINDIVSGYSYESVSDIIEETNGYYYADGAAATAVDINAESYCTFKMYENTLYGLDTYERDLYKFTVGDNGEVSGKEHIDEDVYYYYVTEKGNLIVTADEEDEICELYVDGNYVGETFSYEVDYDDDGTVYFVKPGSDGTGEVKSYKNGELKTLYTDATGFYRYDDIFMALKLPESYYDDYYYYDFTYAERVNSNKAEITVYDGEEALHTATDVLDAVDSYGYFMTCDKDYMLFYSES